jgi:hypothetical protein
LQQSPPLLAHRGHVNWQFINASQGAGPWTILVTTAGITA